MEDHSKSKAGLIDELVTLRRSFDELENEFVFKQFFETGHKLFFGILLAVGIVWTPKGLFGKSIRKK